MHNVTDIIPGLKERIDGLFAEGGERDVILKTICEWMAKDMPHHDWVGFYLVDPENDQMLKLGPFVGAKTEHVFIPFGTGICGQAARTKETFVVQDVTKERNYLSCNERVKSEIVVPILKGSKLVGSLDIDSWTLSPFTDEEINFLESLCKRIADLF